MSASEWNFLYIMDSRADIQHTGYRNYIGVDSLSKVGPPWLVLLNRKCYPFSKIQGHPLYPTLGFFDKTSWEHFVYIKSTYNQGWILIKKPIRACCPYKSMSEILLWTPSIYLAWFRYSHIMLSTFGLNSH